MPVRYPLMVACRSRLKSRRLAGVLGSADGHWGSATRPKSGGLRHAKWIATGSATGSSVTGGPIPKGGQPGSPCYNGDRCLMMRRNGTCRGILCSEAIDRRILRLKLVTISPPDDKLRMISKLSGGIS
jgi:hypothetical protein